MSWTDKVSIECIKKIRNLFKVKTFVETGTFRGMNVLAHKDNFPLIMSCEREEEYFDIATEKCKSIPYINIYLTDSVKFLKDWTPFFKQQKYIIYYLDAHFYDKNRPKGKGKFVVLDELKALKGMKNAIIIIHDFNEILGGIEYDGIKLNFKLLESYLKKVNPNFHYYTNTLKGCDIMKPEETDDKDMKENLIYAWSKPEKTFRGLLYCLPKNLPNKLINEMGLIKWGKII